MSCCFVRRRSGGCCRFIVVSCRRWFCRIYGGSGGGVGEIVVFVGGFCL